MNDTEFGSGQQKFCEILKNISQCRSSIFFYWNISIIYFYLYVIVWPRIEKDGIFIFIHVYLLFTTFYLQWSAINLLSITSTVSDCWQMGSRSTPTAILMDFQRKEGTFFFFKYQTSPPAVSKLSLFLLLFSLSSHTKALFYFFIHFDFFNLPSLFFDLSWWKFVIIAALEKSSIFLYSFVLFLRT